MKIEPNIFHAYDIRGLADSELTEELADRLGRAVVLYTGAEVVVVGRDMRKTSPVLLKALIHGLTAAGADVVNIGLTSTPMFYYAVGEQFAGDPEKGAGVMVTASHNPKEYNGFKLEQGNVMSIGEGSGMEKIKELVMAGAFTDRPEGNVMEIDVRDEYVDKHLSIVPRRDIGSPRVVFDAGNGMSGYVTPGIIKAYGLEKKCKKLFFEPDGTFPNHVPNPAKVENLAWVIDAVRKEKADLGVAYDGDGDRVGFVDETGAPVRSDIMIALMAAEMLRLDPGAAVVYDPVSSRIVKETIEKNGGQPVISKVGHSYFKEKMRATGACFGGEASTHFYFKDFFFAESSDLAVLLALKAMKRTGKSMSELARSFMRYHHSGEINFPVADKDALLAALAARYEGGAKEASRLDGVRFDYGSWWFIVRPSNTEPLVRLNLEADTEEEMKAKLEEVSEIIKSYEQ